MNPRPLVAALVRVPLLLEGLRDGLMHFAEIRAFDVRDGDAAGLLASIRPDAVIVDHEESAEAALAFADSTGAPAMYVRLRDQQLDMARDGAWHLQGGEPSPETIRNLLAGELFGRARA